MKSDEVMKARQKYPALNAAEGTAPPQYPDDEEWDDDESDEDESDEEDGDES